MEKSKKWVRKWVSTCFEGDVTMPKTNFWLIGVICLLSGIVYGLLAAPMTHGVMIACNNGNTENYYEDEDGENGVKRAKTDENNKR